MEMLEDYKSGRLKVEEVISKLKKLPYEDMDYAKIDSHRSLRLPYGKAL